jgi:DNA polymerase-3 subunit chi
LNIRVLFASVKTPADKVRHLVRFVQEHANQNQKLLILTPDSKASEFVDKLLWSEPKQSFIPHFISQTLMDELIVITEEKNNLNASKTLLNLCPEPADFSLFKIQTILELEDVSSKEKSAIFKKKLSSYQKANASIISIN